jgi:hypothetical protein
LSQLRKAGKPSIGRLNNQFKLRWSDFVQLVLELTIQAYEEMKGANVAQQDWEENVFTVHLGDEYLAPIAFESSINITVREKVHTDDMKLGKQKTISAKEIDLALFGTWEKNYRKRRFIWEAKRIGDKRLNDAYESLISEYVNEAIYRFIYLEYAVGLNDAGILAYVLDGNATNIVSDINQTMGKIRKNPPLPPSNHLIQVKAINGFKDIYNSRHIRTDKTRIDLHHLFFTFDF